MLASYNKNIKCQWFCDGRCLLRVLNLASSADLSFSCSTFPIADRVAPIIYSTKTLVQRVVFKKTPNPKCYATVEYVWHIRMWVLMSTFSTEFPPIIMSITKHLLQRLVFGNDFPWKSLKYSLTADLNFGVDLWRHIIIYSWLKSSYVTNVNACQPSVYYCFTWVWGTKATLFAIFNSLWLSNAIWGHDDVIKWKHFSALLALCAGNSPVTSEFPSQRPVTRSFDVFCDLRLNKRLSKQSWGWWWDAIVLIMTSLIWHRTGSTLIHAVACCLAKTSHYLLTYYRLGLVAFI